MTLISDILWLLKKSSGFGVNDYLTPKKEQELSKMYLTPGEYTDNQTIVIPRISQKAYFYEIPVYGIFKRINPYSDLHLSLFDYTGYILGHITYKPNGKNTEPAYHYGFKGINDLNLQFWITPRQRFFDKIIINELTKAYHKYISKIMVNNYSDGIKSEYPLNPQGTCSKRKLTEEQQKTGTNLRKLLREDSGITPKKLFD